MKAGRIIAMAFLAGLGLILLLWLDGRWKADAGGKLSQIPQSTSTGSAAANGKVVPAKPSAIPAMPRRQASGSSAPFVRARPGTGGKNDAPMADTSVRDLFKDAERLAVRDEPQNAAGEFRRISLVRTSMKYPLILLNEVIVRQGHLNEENLVSAEATVADHLLVKVQPGVSDGDLAALAAKYGATVLRKLGTTGLHIVQLPAPDLDSLPAAVAAFAEEKATLQYAEADPVVHGMLAPNDPSFAQEWGMNNSSQTGGTTDADIDAPEAWNVNTGSTAVVVAVIDSGVDYNHPDLVSNMWINPGEVAGSNGVDDDGDGYVDDIRGWDFYNDDNNPMDGHFHGTHVAGTIGAYGNNGVGVAGAAWRVKIMPLKFLASNGGGYLSDALQAIHYATLKSARVTSNSWGGGGYSQALKDVIDDAALHGVLFVAAAGNESNDNDSHPAYPASYNSSNIISVAATDHNDQLAGFSNYGATSVHIAAPGVGILSTFPTTVTPIMAANGMSANYGRISGTSMATPHVTGVAALALAQNLTLPMSQLRTMLTERGDRLTNLAGFILTAGRLNAFNVVNVNWQPSPAQLGLKQFTVSDTEGNHDGYANPGEIIRVTPTLLNTGGQTASAVSAQMVSNQSTAVVLAPASVNAGAAVPFTPLTPATPFRVQLDADLADNTVLTFDLVIQSSGGADVHVPLSIVVTQPKLRTEVSLNFACGEMKADPVRNLVYLINKTDRRILAIDTQQGNVAAVSALDGDAGIAPPVENGSLRSGQLAISLDRTKLYVALTASKKIQVFSLPDLSPLVTLPLDFAPESLVSGINGRLYASSTDYWGKIREVNTANGQVVQSFDKGGSQQFYMHSLLRTNQAGTRLYVAETGLWVVGGPGYMYEYDITGGAAALVKTHPFAMVYLKDFAVDEQQQQRLYTLHGGIYGVQVTDMDTDDYGDVWSFGSAYSAGIAFLPNDPVIYGASGDLYAGNIRKFRRTDGVTLDDYVVATNGDPVPPRGLVITPNGNLLYIKTRWLGTGGGYDGYNFTLGIIGRSSLVITNPPPAPTGPNLNLSTVDFGDLEGNGDSVANAGEIVTLTPTLANTGGQSAANATIQLTPGSGATLLSSASQALGSIGAGVSRAATGFRIQLAPGLATNSTVSFTFTANWDVGQVKTFVYTIVIRATAQTAETLATVQLGEILADQQRNTVYMIDKRYLRLLAFDTNSGHIAKAAALAGPKQLDGAPPEPGLMAESVDGSLLYVALKKAGMIQVFSLPDLATVAAWSYNFQPVALACDAAGRLYATTTDSTQKLVQIDASTGQVLGNSGPAFLSTSILRRNAAGTDLYGSLNGTIYRFSTTGAGAPVQTGALVASPGNAIVDFSVDEGAAVFYSVVNDGKVTVVPFAGGANTTWNLNQTWGSAVAYLPGDTEVLGASDYWYGGGIRRFSRSNGAALQDYVVTTNADSVIQRGLATTPNGRTVYVKRRWIGSSSASSVDGYDYWVGIIGAGSVDLDIPGPEPVVLKSVALTDPAPGNADGYPNPGETVQISPTLKNLSDYQLTGVTIDLLSSDPLATVQNPATRSIGNVGGYVAFTPSPNFSVALSPGLADGREVKLTFRVTYNSGVQQLIPYSLFIAAQVKAEIQVNFAIGEMIADPTRNLAYVIDKTNQRLLAIDTNAGNISGNVKLAADPGSGRLTLSPDGTRLYVALSTANKVQVFNLPALEQADIFDVDFPPVGLAAAADGKLYATSATASEKLRQIDPATGLVLTQFGRKNYYSNSAIKLSGDGRSIFIAELGLSGIGQLDEYAVSDSGPPAYVQWHPFNLANTKDLAVDDTYRRIYTMSGGVYGIGITEMDTGVGNILWPFGAPYGAAICYLPGDNFIYGGSAGPYDGRIRRFARADGRALSDVSIVYQNSSLLDRGMVITANGRIIYAKRQSAGGGGVNGYYYYMGIVGRSSLTMNAINQAPLINLGADRTVSLSQAAGLTATLSDDGSVGNLTVNWTIVNGPKSAMFASSDTSTSASFAEPGVYRVRGTTNDGESKAGDEITVTVVPDKPAVSVTAPAPLAMEYGLVPAQLSFSRTGFPSGALTISYSVAGTAVAGSDYAALPGTIVIPDGFASVNVNVAPLFVSQTQPDKSVVVSVNSSASYDPGVSQQANVTIKDRSYLNWKALNLSTLPPGDQEDGAMPYRDGVPNLLRYALSLNPKAADTSGLPRTAIPPPLNGKHYLTITFKRLQSAADVSYVVEVSQDMINWNSGPTYTVEDSVAPNPDGTESVTVRDLTPVSDASKRFIRLRVVK